MSERELLHTDRVLVVEGKYDAARLSHLTDAMILLTDGFGIYNIQYFEIFGYKGWNGRI